MSGGTYSLNGGFWGAFVPVQTPGAPTLYLTNLFNGTATIAWVPNTPGFVVQQVTALTPVPIVWSQRAGDLHERRDHSGLAEHALLPALQTVAKQAARDRRNSAPDFLAALRAALR